MIAELVLTAPTAVAVVTGATFAWRHRHGELLPTGELADDGSGWIYFVTGSEGPVKIGLSRDEPSQRRLPELKTMSPIPLRIVHKLWTPDRYAGEAAIHELLAEYREHGEWFDRDATLYYIDHLKGLA